MNMPINLSRPDSALILHTRKNQATNQLASGPDEKKLGIERTSSPATCGVSHPAPVTVRPTGWCSSPWQPRNYAARVNYRPRLGDILRPITTGAGRTVLADRGRLRRLRCIVEAKPPCYVIASYANDEPGTICRTTGPNLAHLSVCVCAQRVRSLRFGVWNQLGQWFVCVCVCVSMFFLYQPFHSVPFLSAPPTGEKFALWAIHRLPGPRAMADNR